MRHSNRIVLFSNPAKSWGLKRGFKRHDAIRAISRRAGIKAAAKGPPDGGCSFRYNYYVAGHRFEYKPRYVVHMREAQINVRVPIMASQFNPWKTAVAVVIYVALCMLILIFSPPDYAARDGLVQTSAPAPTPAASVSGTRQAT